MMNAVLEIKNLSAGYPHKKIFKDFNIEGIPNGSIVALVGPNAAGKSTLLKSVASLLKVEGEIHYKQLNILKESKINRSKIVGYMPQHQRDEIELTVIESLITVLKVNALDHNSSLPEIEKRGFDLLEEIGLLDIALEPLKNLSGGQKQMASLAQAIIRKPQILLLDEPTSALDLHHQVAVMKYLKNYAAKGNIIIMVLHDLNLAARWSDFLVVLSKGKIYNYGKAADVLTPQMLNDVYHVKGRVEKCSNHFLQVMVDA